MKKESLKIGTVTLLCVSLIFFAGCGARDNISKGGEKAEGELPGQTLVCDRH